MVAQMGPAACERRKASVGEVAENGGGRKLRGPAEEEGWPCIDVRPPAETGLRGWGGTP